jgi:NADH dehydrogenase
VSAGTVLVDGATGYVGSHLANQLSRKGYPVRCLIRPHANEADVAVLKTLNVETTPVDLFDRSQAACNAFQGVKVAVHLIGSVAPRRGERLTDLHVEMTRRFAELAKGAAVEKVVMVTALGAAADAASLYHRTKFWAEQQLKESGVNCLILRPALLVGKTFGRRNSKLITRIIDLIKTRRLVPIINGGVNRIQPLFIDDVVDAIVNCVASYPGSGGSQAPVLELAGPDVITMRQLYEELMEVVGCRKPLLNVPAPLANLVACAAELLQPVPIISRDQIKLSGSDNTSSGRDISEKLSIRPTSLTDALRTYANTGNDLACASAARE